MLTAIQALTAARLADDAAARDRALDTLAFVPSVAPARRDPSVRSVARVYARDHYQCRYCGRRLVLASMLRLLSRLHPEVFPYQANWKTGVAHPAYVTLSATLDHVVPVALGGDSVDEENLVCACWSCNLRKSDLSLAAAGFELTLASADPTWDGLSSAYRMLWEATGRLELGAHEREWMRAVDAAPAVNRQASQSSHLPVAGNAT